MALVRITGKAGLVQSRTVTSNKEATKGQQFTFHTAAVIVADSGVADLSFDPTRDGRTFAYGDAVDVLAEASAFGGRVQLNYVADYPKALREAEADALLTTAGS